MGNVFTAPFSAIAVTAAQDLWELLAPTDSRLRIKEIRFGQYSDAGATEAELLGVTFRRGDTVSGSGGGTITPVNVKGHTGAGASTTTVERNNTTQASGGTLVWADAWNVQAPFLYIPDDGDDRFTVEKATRFVVTLTVPADSITMNGTILFEEIGQAPA
jgi:hypothetical protein